MLTAFRTFLQQNYNWIKHCKFLNQIVSFVTAKYTIFSHLNSMLGLGENSVLCYAQPTVSVVKL
jgi:hypothetical protein